LIAQWFFSRYMTKIVSFQFFCQPLQYALQDTEERAELIEELESDAGCSKAMAGLFTVQERTPLLLIHSLLHLIGYDHETDEDWAEMTAREEEVIKQYYAHLRAEGKTVPAPHPLLVDREPGPAES
jgi:rRNA maturation RNase YbeY